MAAQTNDIAMVNLDKDAQESGFYKEYPYFAKVTIPPNTYKGVDYEVNSFQDAALWVANKDVSEEAVYQMLSLIFTDEGLAHMVSQKKNLQEHVHSIRPHRRCHPVSSGC